MNKCSWTATPLSSHQPLREKERDLDMKTSNLRNHPNETNSFFLTILLYFMFILKFQCQSIFIACICVCVPPMSTGWVWVGIIKIVYRNLHFKPIAFRWKILHIWLIIRLLLLSLTHNVSNVRRLSLSTLYFNVLFSDSDFFLGFQFNSVAKRSLTHRIQLCIYFHHGRIK